MGIRANLRALALVSVLAADAWAGHVEDGKDGSTTIHFACYRLPDRERTDPMGRAEAAVLAEFVRQYPAIFAERYRAKYKAAPAVYGKHNWDEVRVAPEQFRRRRQHAPDTSMSEAARIDLRSGDAADIVYASFRASDDYIQEGFLYPLDRPEDGYLTAMTDAERRFAIHEKLWPVVKRRGPGGDEHAWLLPFGGTLGRVMLYRKDLLEKAGVPSPTNDWTWEDLLAACRKLTDPRDGTHGILLGSGLSESWYWTAFLWSAGGEVVVHDRKQNSWRAAFDSPAAVTALDFYMRLTSEPWVDETGRTRYGYAYMNNAEGRREWDLGKIGFFQSYVSEVVLATIDPAVTGMVAMPLGYPDEKGERHRGSELNSRMQGLYAKIREPAVRDAAWEYIRFQSSPAAARIRAEIFVESGLGPFMNPELLRLCGREDLIARAPEGWHEAFRIALETGKLEPYGPGCEGIYYFMTIPIGKARDVMTRGRLPTDRAARQVGLQKLLLEGTTEADLRLRAGRD